MRAAHALIARYYCCGGQNRAAKAEKHDPQTVQRQWPGKSTAKTAPDPARDAKIAVTTRHTLRMHRFI